MDKISSKILKPFLQLSIKTISGCFFKYKYYNYVKCKIISPHLTSPWSCLHAWGKKKKGKQTRLSQGRMKVQMPWGLCQLNLNCRVQGLQPQGDSSPGACLHACSHWETHSQALSPKLRHWSQSSGYLPLDSGARADLLVPDEEASSFKPGRQPTLSLQVPCCLFPLLPSAWTLLCPRAPGDADPFPFVTISSLFARWLGPGICLAHRCFLGICTCVCIKRGSWELNAAAAASQPATCEGAHGHLVARVGTVSLRLFTWSQLPFSCCFWLQLQPYVNNAPCVHVSHLAHKLIKHF